MRYLAFTAALALLAPGLHPGGLLQAAPAKGSGFTQLAIWTSGSGEHRAEVVLLSSQLREKGKQLELLLVKDPLGHRTILSREHWPLEGRIEILLIEQTSNWRMAIQEESIRFESFDQIAQPAVVAAKITERDRPVKLSVRVSGMAPFTLSSNLWNPELPHSLYRQLESAGLAEKLVTTMPSPVRDSFWFLSSFLEGSDCASCLAQFSTPLGILHEALSAHDSREDKALYTGLRWKAIPEVTRPEVSIKEERVRAFLKDFKKLDHDIPELRDPE